MRGRLKPLPALFPEEERSKQPSAFSILRALIGEFQQRAGFAAGAGGRVRIRSAVPVRSDRAEAAAPRRTRICSCSCATTFTSWIARRSRSSAFVTISSWAICPPRAWRAPALRRAARPNVRTTPSRSDHQPEEYMAKVETVREGMRQGEYYEVVLRQTFQAHLFRERVRAVRADPARQPQPLRVSAAIGRRAVDRRVARNVRARGRQPRGDLPDCGNRAPHGRSAARRRQHPRAAEFHQGRIRADHVQRRGPQR